MHNIDYFILYHIAKLNYVFEIFNCINQCEILMFVAKHNRKFKTNFFIDRNLTTFEFFDNFIFSIFDCNIITSILF